MKVLYTSDIHAHPSHLESTFRQALAHAVDALIIGGDLIPHYLSDSVSDGVLKAQIQYLKNTLIPAAAGFRKQRDVPVYLDLGNDDYMDSRRALLPHDGELFHLIHMKRLPLTDGLDIVGYMMVPPTPFARKDWEKPDVPGRPYPKGTFVVRDGHRSRDGCLESTRLDWKSPDTMEADLTHLSKLIQRPFVFVSHSPPYETPLDLVTAGQHVGSAAVRRFIERWSRKGDLIVSLHGHIHESPIRSGETAVKFGRSICLNPGQGSTGPDTFHYALLHLRGGASPALERYETH